MFCSVSIDIKELVVKWLLVITGLKLKPLTKKWDKKLANFKMYQL